ncbi:MAG: pantetheine-phosphate adenylyltransferase [Planctomycetes bacterium RIFCSPHIGHO2_02_FULL_50_42]|nr:MAG: pantetheine-phosphate adenylyltransferase [Planctomycetes bacterium GWA2_50_13]OHB89552.1 MAG: pantetheine-phosphate adenylyltransferase [Planctomycetes bacterium RIFCSPHIGHO2_02_FULL_50_42]OHB92674.1 MAG: pantetheine-phosphate adenylyltransferase [Planctomycetes bacterium RIFCSPHIGHO2_12_FULL_51_37]OHB95715.1 MAG: pantetheine-phosphate adenylyltransferase [Planctomycetes bacterium RIFCSPLOWO2_02_FULL_50_16]OHC02961.1 MAG: pantetheine-phosphate adenylyltransferase [Planctomycetes bacter
MTKAVYPGTFDPLTFGHLDVVERGSKVFDEVIVAIGINPIKEPLFSVEERKQMIADHIKHLKNVKVDSFEGMLVDYLRKKNIHIILRGIRTVSDFEYEFQMALTNRAVRKDIETIFIMTSEQYSFLNSTLIKEAASLGGDVSAFVPADIEKSLKKRLRRKTN